MDNIGADVAVIHVAWTWECRGRESEGAEVLPGTTWYEGFPQTVLDVVITRRSDGLTLYSAELTWLDFDDGGGTVRIVVSP